MQHKKQPVLLEPPRLPRRQMLLDRREQLLGQLVESVRRDSRRRSKRLLRRINEITELASLYAAVEQRVASVPNGARVYTVSSLFLFESFLELTADNKEQLFFVTGPEIGDSFILDQRIRFAH